MFRIDAPQLTPHRRRRAADLLELAYPTSGRSSIDSFSSVLAATAVGICLQTYVLIFKMPQILHKLMHQRRGIVGASSSCRI